MLLLLFCSALHVSGQSPDTLHRGKLDVGISFSPDYSYRTLKSDEANKWMEQAYDSVEVGRIGFTAGLSAIYHLNAKVSLCSGLLFADRGEKTKKYSIQPVNNYKNHYYYLDIPLKINYYFVQKKISMYLSAGFSANIFIFGKTTVEQGLSSDKINMKAPEGISRFGGSFLAALGIDCPLTDRWYFKLEPNYRKSLSPAADSGVRRYFYSAGLNFGFLCRL